MSDIDETLNRDLDDAIGARLGSAALEQFSKIRKSHFWYWKTHRVCDVRTLQGLRYYLYHAKLLTLAPLNQLVSDRPFHEYAAALGIPLDHFEHSDLFAGDDVPEVERLRHFFEPGDGVAQYEEARLGWITIGHGKSFGYALETTLANCLREPMRYRKACKSYLHSGFASTMKTLEVWSTACMIDEIEGRPLNLDHASPDQTLCGSVTDPGDLSEAILLQSLSQAENWLERREAHVHQTDGELSVFVVVLGLLVDELLARLAIPNSMAFGYKFTSAVLASTLEKFDAIFREGRTTANATQLRVSIEKLLGDCEATSKSFSLRQRTDQQWLRECRIVADQLRDFGFAHRANGSLSNEHADIVFTTSNMLWRWTFFIDQRDAFNDLQPSFSAGPRAAAADLVWSWLQRPWGILTPTDMEQAFRGFIPGEAEDEMPRALSVLGPMLKTNATKYLGVRFGIAATRAETAIKGLIRRRQSIYLLRRLTREVRRQPSPGEEEFAQTAYTVISVLSRYLFQAQFENLRSLQDNPEELPTVLRSGDWLRTLLSSDKAELRVLFDHGERLELNQYLDDPATFVGKAFTFDEPDFNIAEHLGFFPTERFVFTAPLPESGLD